MKQLILPLNILLKLPQGTNEYDGWERVEEWETEGISFWIKTADSDPVEVQTLLDFHPIFINEIKTSQD